MTEICRRITAIIFVLLLFAVGGYTAYSMIPELTAVSDETGADAAAGEDQPDFRTSLEEMIQTKIAAKYEWINLNGLFHRAMGDTIIRDSSYNVYKLSNGQIIYGLVEKEMDPFAGEVARLDRKLDDMGTELMYVQLPFKIKDDSYMPPGTHANGNENADELVKLLRKKKVNTLDLRELIEEQDMDWDSLFFKTDHHWKPETAFWAAGEIMKKISNDLGFKYNKKYYDDSSYRHIDYNNYMLGSIGRRTGKWYAGLDDLTLYEPEFETDLQFEGVINSRSTDVREGSFMDSMYAWDQLQKKADFERNNYSAYTGKVYRKVRIRNRLADNGLKVLMIRESFSCALLPFLAVNAEEVVTVDLRKYHGDLLRLIKREKPDLVMIAYNPSAFAGEQFDFFGERE